MYTVQAIQAESMCPTPFIRSNPMELSQKCSCLFYVILNYRWITQRRISVVLCLHCGFDCVPSGTRPSQFIGDRVYDVTEWAGTKKNNKFILRQIWAKKGFLCTKTYEKLWREWQSRKERLRRSTGKGRRKRKTERIMRRARDVCWKNIVNSMGNSYWV